MQLPNIVALFRISDFIYMYISIYIYICICVCVYSFVAGVCVNLGYPGMALFLVEILVDPLDGFRKIR